VGGGQARRQGARQGEREREGREGQGAGCKPDGVVLVGLRRGIVVIINQRS
jgi:hypothetical protein